MGIAIDNIVLGLPESDPEAGYEGPARALATFYAELLGMRILRQDWFMVGDDYRHGDQARQIADSLPRLAFGDGPSPREMPRWPDPMYPQQLHIDLPASDLAAAETSALGLGATRLQDKGDYRSYADPVGHPFCLYHDPADADLAAGQPLSGRIGRVVIDCFSPRALAGFYATLLDMPRREVDTPERVVIARDDGMLPALAFQHAQVPAPRWPDPAYPQQIHLDIFAEDSEAAQKLALRLGAIRLPDMGGSAPVYADPAGHPFCLSSPGT